MDHLESTGSPGVRLVSLASLDHLAYRLRNTLEVVVRCTLDRLPNHHVEREFRTWIAISDQTAQPCCSYIAATLCSGV